MRAVIIKKYGNEDVVQIATLQKPQIKDSEVLVEVYSAGVNPLDIKVRKGEMKPLLTYKFPLILGTDVSGKILAIGSKVKKYKVGDEIYASLNTKQMGAFADFVAIDEQVLSLKPANLTPNEAASIPLVGLTVYQALNEYAQIKAGQKVFIQAGSGGIGTFAIQFAKAMGAEVATTTSQKNVEWVKKLGADQVIDYTKDNYKNILKNYDVFFNSVDGEPIENGLAILKPGGHLLSIVGPPDAKFAKKAKLNILFQIITGLLGRKINKLAKKVDVKYNFVFVTPSGSQLEIIKKLIESEKIKPTIDKVFSVEQVKEAFAYQALGRTKGKVVLKFRDE